MRRTQLYLDDNLWDALHDRARSERTTISELVRQAVRERYFGKLDEQRQAMQAFVGIGRKGSRGSGGSEIDAVEAVRSLRRGDRLERLQK